MKSWNKEEEKKFFLKRGHINLFKYVTPRQLNEPYNTVTPIDKLGTMSGALTDITGKMSEALTDILGTMSGALTHHLEGQ